MFAGEKAFSRQMTEKTSQNKKMHDITSCYVTRFHCWFMYVK